MELWFSENHTDNVKFSIRVDRHLISVQSDFQKIDVFDTPEFGRVLVIDGYLMLTEKDEFIYHEMIVHVPMAVNPHIKRILVIGAGDGGTVRELTRYKTVESIDMVEIDRQVVEICKEYIPKTASGFNDERLNLYFEDGLNFVKRKKNEYDLIIVDSTDPVGPGLELFTREFYENCYKALVDDGILVNQHESPYYP
ncbi:MAG: polyamine aminopropyltransferase, partial [Sedimentibacter sp.]|nr:polyamine aminopropyltransferase [Sedimentibacter sp.]